MRKIIIYPILAAVTMTAVVSGCTKTAIPEGKEFRFISTASGIHTRTEYSGQGTVDGSGLLTCERINWSVGDLIRIYSAESKKPDGSHEGDYIVEAFSNATDLVSSAIVSSTTPNGLQWVPGVVNYVFHALYPSPSTQTYSAAEQAKVSISDTRMTGIIPSTQSLIWTGAKGVPQMKYAYMYAKAEAVAYDQKVHMQFQPEFTAFEFEIGSGENDLVNVTSFTLETTASGSVLAGDFIIPTASPQTPSSFTFSNTSSKVTLNFEDLSGGSLAVQKGSPVTFTVFTLPRTVSSMKISFVTSQLGTRSLLLNRSDGTPLSFEAFKKHRIYGLSFPNLLSLEGEPILWDHQSAGESIIWD